jgi:hypothetical protein
LSLSRRFERFLIGWASSHAARALPLVRQTGLYAASDFAMMSDPSTAMTHCNY